MNLGGGVLNGVGQRKVRSDKKRDVKPTVKVELKDAIYRLSYITQTPVKDVAERMIEYAIRNQSILNNLAHSFRRVVRINDTLYLGHIDNKRIDRREDGVCERLTSRLTSHDYETVSALAYALDVNPTRVCAVLLEASMRDFTFVNTYVSCYLKTQLTSSQMKELRSIMQYVNEDAEEQMSFTTLLSMIVDEVSAPVSRIKDAVSEFIINNWREQKKD